MRRVSRALAPRPTTPTWVLAAGLVVSAVVSSAGASGWAQVGLSESELALSSLSFVAVPLEAGDFDRPAIDFISVDAAGNTIGWGLGEPRETVFSEVSRGAETKVDVGLTASYGRTLSGNGMRFFYKGEAESSDSSRGLGLAMWDRVTGGARLVYSTGSFFYSVDHAGRRIALQSDSDAGAQYLLADVETGSATRLTDDPQAIVFPQGAADCPYATGTTPVINSDGTRIAIATRATLGLVDADPAVGCHIVVYDIAARRFRHVVGLPRELTVTVGPAISGDGRWLSFTISRSVGSGPRRSTAALLDLDTGTLTESVLGEPTGGDQTFESRITIDGTAIVVASSADLDPTVGNPDRNMELFILDRGGGRIEQISDTTGAIGQNSGSCNFPHFAVNRDGSVIAVMYPSDEEPPCRYEGPPRHRATGLYYRATRFIRRRPGNRGPEWHPAPPAEVAVAAGATVSVALGGRDPDGDRLTFFAQELGGVNVPDGAGFVDHHDGTATFTWATRVEQAGTYTVRVALFDEGGEVRTADVRIVVGPRGSRGCAGDCDGDGVVAVSELVTAVEIAQERAALSSCAAADGGGDGAVTVEELIAATRAALSGCPPP